jgi:hypothetical protein
MGSVGAPMSPSIHTCIHVHFDVPRDLGAVFGSVFSGTQHRRLGSARRGGAAVADGKPSTVNSLDVMAVTMGTY